MTWSTERESCMFWRMRIRRARTGSDKNWALLFRDRSLGREKEAEAGERVR